MKQTTRLLGALALLLCIAYPVWGKGTANVKNTIHNLSATGIDPFFPGVPGFSLYATDEDEICVFCHTPHGGILTGPLWNHSTPGANSFTHYNSATLSSTLQALFVREVKPESLLCMACHDGSISVNHVLNVPNDRTTPIETDLTGDPDTLMIALAGVQTARIGANPFGGDSFGTGDLSDDHPISFSYSDVLLDPTYASGSRVGELYDIPTALSKGVRFFGAENRVECSSCHDPHVEYNYIDKLDYAPFLITPNAGSALCLACHNK